MASYLFPALGRHSCSLRGSYLSRAVKKAISRAGIRTRGPLGLAQPGNFVRPPRSGWKWIRYENVWSNKLTRSRGLIAQSCLVQTLPDTHYCCRRWDPGTVLGRKWTFPKGLRLCRRYVMWFCDGARPALTALACWIPGNLPADCSSISHLFNAKGMSLAFGKTIENVAPW